MIALADLSSNTEEEVLTHLKENYGDGENELRLTNMEILVAYESVGDYGCDSSSYFLLREKETNKLFEVHGSHCSCYGFEGQLQLEEITLEVLVDNAINNKSIFYTGGYDDNSNENIEKVKNFIIEHNNEIL